MIDVSSAFNWAGQKVSDLVFGEIEARLRQGGEAVVAEARTLAPVRTGALRNSIGYRVEGRTLTISVGAYYGLFQEYGTRTIHPHPFIRPALAAAGRIFGGQIDMEFNAPAIASPLIHHRGTFIAPSGIQPRPLTQAQHRHVREHLMPSARRLHKGNVKRARMVVKRLGV